MQTGNVRNRGIELSLGYNHSWGDFSWNTNFTYSMNRNKIVELLDDEDEVINAGGLNGANIILKKGGTMGDLYTYTDFARDQEGNIALDASGNVIRQTLSNPEYRGSVLPKGNFGFSNEFSWKAINLGFLITARVGGIVLSQTQAILDYYGVSKRTADAREAGGIPVNTGMVSAESYTLPRSLTKGFNVSLNLTANNLFLIYCKAPFDPESTGSTGTFYQGFDYFMQPSLRSLGFNVKVSF